ncbi:MAG: HipA domain-containing protein [Bacteroidota bacterium]
MNRCPITYEPCGKEQYTLAGLRLLDKSLKNFHPLPFSAQEQRKEAAIRMKQMSIQGVQPKLSAQLDTRNATFKIVDQKGKYIIKPQSDLFQQVPENEDVSMRMAKVVGIEVPLHGMVYSKDGSLSYFIKRFDRVGRKQKLPVEDFAQLAGLSRETKYDFTLEKIIRLIDQFCTFPVLERIKFFKLVLFSFVIGNEDMHLKNFSLITRKSKVEFSPAYDLLNSTLAIDGAEEEMALHLAGKRSRFKRRELIGYLGRERLSLNEETIAQVERDFQQVFASWEKLIRTSFLSEQRKNTYLELIKERFQRLQWII